jgi:hypothetical protein
MHHYPIVGFALESPSAPKLIDLHQNSRSPWSEAPPLSPVLPRGRLRWSRRAYGPVGGPSDGSGPVGGCGDLSGRREHGGLLSPVLVPDHKAEVCPVAPDDPEVARLSASRSPQLPARPCQPMHHNRHEQHDRPDDQPSRRVAVPSSDCCDQHAACHAHDRSVPGSHLVSLGGATGALVN